MIKGIRNTSLNTATEIEVRTFKEALTKLINDFNRSNKLLSLSCNDPCRKATFTLKIDSLRAMPFAVTPSIAQEVELT